MDERPTAVRLCKVLPHPDIPDAPTMGPLLLGPIAFAWNQPRELLNEEKVGAVLSCVSAEGDELPKILAEAGISEEKHQYIALEDSRESGRRSGTLSGESQGSLAKACRFIHTNREQGIGVLVHCDMGVMRSPSVVVGYLILHYGLSFDAAVSIVKQAAPKSQFRLFASSLRAIDQRLRLDEEGYSSGDNAMLHAPATPQYFSPSMSPLQLQMPLGSSVSGTTQLRSFPQMGPLCPFNESQEDLPQAHMEDSLGYGMPAQSQTSILGASPTRARSEASDSLSPKRLVPMRLAVAKKASPPDTHHSVIGEDSPPNRPPSH